jgi:uncharacterized membrane protein YhaH (DUF805 family)
MLGDMGVCPKCRAEFNIENAPATKLDLLCSLEGRIGRVDFIIGTAVGLVVLAVALVVAAAGEWLMDLIGLTLFAVSISILWSSVVKRLHDLGMTGWISIVMPPLTPAVIYFALMPGTNGPNKYGDTATRFFGKSEKAAGEDETDTHNAVAPIAATEQKEVRSHGNTQGGHESEKGPSRSTGQ